MSIETDIAQMKQQQEQAKTLFTKLQGVIEYLEGKLEQEKQEKATEKKKPVGKNK